LGVSLALAGALLGVGCSASNPDHSNTPGTQGSGSAGSPSSTGSGTGAAGSGAGGVVSGAAGTGASMPPEGTAGAAGGGAAGFGFAGTTGAAGTTGSAGAGSGAGGIPAGVDGGAVDAGVMCLVTIDRIDPSSGDVIPSFANLEAGPASTLRLRASVSGWNGAGALDGGGPRWRWSVKKSGGHTGVSDGNYTTFDDSTIDVSLDTDGTYQIMASIQGAPACDRSPLVIQVAPPEAATFRLRVMPPAAAQLPVREIIVNSTSIGDAPQPIDLGDAKSTATVSLSPVDVRGYPLPSYVRITSPSFQFDIEGDTGRGALVAPLATLLAYDVLVLPDNGLAPLLVSGSPDLITSQMSVAVGPGARVTGVAHDGAGMPVAGARVVLEAGVRPSTIGVSGADGSFGLTTRDGAHGADILPPAGSGLPEAHVAASPGIVVPADLPSVALDMTWANLPSSALTVTVIGPGESIAPVAGAEVRVDLATPLPNVGTLRVHGATTAQLTATGTAHGDVVTDANGVARFGRLPTGTYHVIVAPPAGFVGGAITLPPDVTLTGADASVPIALAVPVTISRTLSAITAGATAGSRVTAIDRGLLAAPTMATATADATGAYTLTLAAGRTYELLVDPPANQGIARSVVNVVTPSTTNGPQTDVVPPALFWRGSITGAGRSVPGALVQAFCVQPASTCFDAALPLAQGTTASDGSITLILPGAVAPAMTP
jgi:hypothetical protein